MSCPKYKNLSSWQKQLVSQLGNYESFKQLWKEAYRTQNVLVCKLLDIPFEYPTIDLAMLNKALHKSFPSDATHCRINGRLHKIITNDSHLS